MVKGWSRMKEPAGAGVGRGRGGCGGGGGRGGGGGGGRRERRRSRRRGLRGSRAPPKTMCRSPACCAERVDTWPMLLDTIRSSESATSCARKEPHLRVECPESRKGLGRVAQGAPRIEVGLSRQAASLGSVSELSLKCVSELCRELCREVSRRLPRGECRTSPSTRRATPPAGRGPPAAPPAGAEAPS